jgi:uroporphyrinogen-III synthase
MTYSAQLLDNVTAPLPLVINTRPIERAAALTQYLQAAGLIVIDMPVLALQPLAVTDEDMTLMRQWFAGDYQALVVVSPTAAALGVAVWQVLEHERTDTEVERFDIPSHLIAVGDATALVLKNAVLSGKNYQVLQPTIANNEGMLAMPEIATLKAGDKVMIWRGRGGRRLLVDNLQARGVHIDSIEWYERIVPVAAQAQYQQWQRQFTMHYKRLSNRPKPIVIISSGTAFEHWATIVSQVQSTDVAACPDAGMYTSESFDSELLTLSDFIYVVLGARLEDMLAEQQLSYWRVEDLAPKTILAAINSGH